MFVRSVQHGVYATFEMRSPCLCACVYVKVKNGIGLYLADAWLQWMPSNEKIKNFNEKEFRYNSWLLRIGCWKFNVVRVYMLIGIENMQANLHNLIFDYDIGLNRKNSSVLQTNERINCLSSHLYLYSMKLTKNF